MSEFTIGQILKNSSGEFTKIISHKRGIYGISGWGSLVTAEKATVARQFINKYGLKYAEVKIVKSSTPAKKVEEVQKAEDVDLTDEEIENLPIEKPTKSKLSVMTVDDLRGMAMALEIDTTDLKKKDILEKLYTHFGL